MYTAPAKILKISRDQVKDLVKDLSRGQWMKIPAGHDNNIAWNVGHLIWAQAGLCYGRSSLTIPIDRAPYTKLYGIGTSPADWEDDPDPAALMEMFMHQADQQLKDAETGLFEDVVFEPWTTGGGAHFATLLDMQIYNVTHEGEHRGMIMALRNLV